MVSMTLQLQRKKLNILQQYLQEIEAILEFWGPFKGPGCQADWDHRARTVSLHSLTPGEAFQHRKRIRQKRGQRSSLQVGGTNLNVALTNHLGWFEEKFLGEHPFWEGGGLTGDHPFLPFYLSFCLYLFYALLRNDHWSIVIMFLNVLQAWNEHGLQQQKIVLNVFNHKEITVDTKAVFNFTLLVLSLVF